MKKIMVFAIAAAIVIAITGGSRMCLSYKNISLKDNSDIVSQSFINNEKISNIGDPYIIKYEDRYYVTATGDGNGYDLYSSDNLMDWNQEGRIFSSSSKEGWVRSSLWQPQLVIGDDGLFYLYYCGQNDDRSLRIGVAVSESITGPYKDALGRPLLPYNIATIDPNLFVDEDGSKYLYFSRDCSENLVDGYHTSQLYCIAMDSYTQIKEDNDPTLLVTPDQDWELQNGDYRWNEGPDMIRKGDTYYLFYSGGFYGDATYSIGCATSDSPMGPFVKYENNPLIASTDEVSGPGNNSYFYSPDGKELYTCYHTHVIKLIGGGNRKVTIDRCGFREDGTFYINGPTTTHQTPISGTNGFEKVEPVSVKATGTIEGRTPNALIDGENLNSKNQDDYEWRCTNSKDSKVTLDFGDKTKINCVYIYGSSNMSYEVKRIKLKFDGCFIDEIYVPACSEEPTVLYFDDIETSSVDISCVDYGDADGMGISDISFYYKQ